MTLKICGGFSFFKKASFALGLYKMYIYFCATGMEVGVVEDEKSSFQTCM